jgi:hypothetical protein
MKAMELAGCCGAAIFHGFANTMVGYHLAGGNGLKPPTPEEIDKWLEAQEKFQSKAQGKGLVTALLNDEQFKAIGYIFEKRGYQVTGPFYNPRHRTRLYFLLKGMFPCPEEDSKELRANGKIGADLSVYGRLTSSEYNKMARAAGVPVNTTRWREQQDDA